MRIACCFVELGADLYEDGYHNITNIDQSSVVISQMHDRYSDKEEMECTLLVSHSRI
jgi:hypothetical protein